MPPNESSKLSEFFKPNQEEFKLPTQEAAEEPSENEELPADLKNRHIRKMESKLQSQREEMRQMASRIEALSESQKLREQVGEREWEKMASRIYGNEKPENAAATELLINSLREVREEAKREALEAMRQEYAQQQQDVEKESQTLDSYIEQIEEEYGVDLTSTASAREKQKEYFQLLSRLSPKDANGDIVDYADPFEVYEIFNARQPQSRSKELAARSMTPSRSVEQPVAQDATFKFLKENGILDSF